MTQRKDGVMTQAQILATLLVIRQQTYDTKQRKALERAINILQAARGDWDHDEMGMPI